MSVTKLDEHIKSGNRGKIINIMYDERKIKHINFYTEKKTTHESSH